MHLRNVLGIGGVEGNPEKDERGIMIRAHLLGPLHPADRAVDPQAQIHREAVAQLALLGFEMGVAVGFVCHGFTCLGIHAASMAAPLTDCKAGSLCVRFRSSPVSVMSHL